MSTVTPNPRILLVDDDPDILAAFDAADPTPGNGIADIYGCQESWTCDDIITSQIAFSEWENIEQVISETSLVAGVPSEGLQEKNAS